MKKLRQTKNAGKQKTRREKSFFTGVMEEARENGSAKKHVELDMDDMFGGKALMYDDEKVVRKEPKKKKKPRKTGASSTTSSVSNNFSTTTVEAVFGKKEKDEFEFNNPFAQEVVYDVLQKGGGSYKKVAKQLFALEQLMKKKAPDDKSPDFEGEVELDEKEERKPKKEKKKGKDKKVVDELDGVLAHLPKKLAAVAKGMGPDTYWTLGTVLASDVSIYTKMRILKKISGVLKAMHGEERFHLSLSLDAVLFDRNFEVYLAKSEESSENKSKAKRLDMLDLGILILSLFKEEGIQGEEYAKVLNLRATEYKALSATEEDEDEKYDENLALSQVIEEELRKAFETTICQNTIIELCVQLCSPLLDMRPEADDVFPWVAESCKEVVKNEARDSTLTIVQRLFSNKALMKDVITGVEVEAIEDDDEEEEEEEEEVKEETKSVISNDSYQPPVEEQETKEERKNKRKSVLAAFLEETGDDDTSKSVVAPKRKSTGGRQRRRSLDRGYQDAQRKLTQDETLSNINLDPEQIKQFQANMGSNMLASINIPEPEELKIRFQNQQRLRIDVALSIIKRARLILSEEPNLLQLEAPCMVVGDIHGQFFDLINLFDQGGEPGSVISVDSNGNERRRQYLFLGDYVDRGEFSCEVLLYLLSLKAKYPAHIWLIRGNHECRTVAAYFGFKDECSKKYGLPLFNYAAETFQTMPIAATVNTVGGKFLCLHGGISPNVTSLHQFTEFDRFTEPAMTGFLCDVLWADPIKEDFEDGQTSTVSEFLSMDYLPNPARGCSFRYGFRAIVQFLAINGLAGIIRAHEVQEEGFLYHFQETGKGGNSSNAPPVTTVFSAPNYCGRYGNKAAYIQISRDLQVKSVRKRGLFRKKKKQGVDLGAIVSPAKLMKPIQYQAVESPDAIVFDGPEKDSHLNVEKVCPYMPTSFSAFVQKALELAESGSNGNEGVSQQDLEELHKKEEEARKKLEEEKEEAPPPAPPKLHGQENKKNPNWKALQMLGLTDDGSGNIDPQRGSVVERKKKKKKKPKNREFTEAARNDSVFEMRPELIKGKVSEAVKKFEGQDIFKNLPDTIRLKEEAEKKRRENKRLSMARDGQEKITFSKEEITALQALYLLIDRNGSGEIDITDLINWSRDSGNAVQREEAELCLKYVDYDRDGKIGFKDYLVFAGKSKQTWLGEQYEKVMSQLNNMRQTDGGNN